MDKKNNKLDKLISIAIWVLLVFLFIVLPSGHTRNVSMSQEERMYYLFFSGITTTIYTLSFIKAKRNNQIKGFGWEFSSVFAVMVVIYFFSMLVGLLLNS